MYSASVLDIAMLFFLFDDHLMFCMWKSLPFNQGLNFVPKVVITNSGKVPVKAAKQSSPRAAASTSTARYVNTAANRPTVNEIDGGFVAFRGSPKGGKISRKCTIRTGKLDFEDVYFVKELKFNLFSVLQMCDKKNSFLFTETECLVLYPDFKLPDENQVLLKVPRHNNMYSFNLKNVVPTGGLTCLFAKATTDESNLWHRRLGHINFKTMNKLVRENLVRVAERKNRTLIEAAKTMLADSLLPTTFWAEAVSTACYIQNRVLVTKPHNKTSYELLIGRTPNLDFMKPFRCPVTILNTLNHLGKFEGKADEGFLVGYFVNCIEINANAGKAGYERASDHEYILLSFMASSTQSSDDSEVPDKEDDGVSIGSGINDQEKTNSSTQDVGIAEPSINTANININNVGSNDSSMPSLEETSIFNAIYDNKKVGAEADTNNLELPIVASHILITKGIDYDEVFAPVARIEAIKIFLAYASFMGFIVYQMDVKRAFLYGIIEEEVYVCQPPGFEDPHFPNKVYKIMHKRFQMSSMGELTFFLGLQVKQKDDVIFISQDKYVVYILKKIDFITVKKESTVIEPNKTLIKDADAEDVDIYLYRSMIGSLMYLTASRNSPFDLEAFSDSDYAGAGLDRKSTIGGCQFLGKRLISWQCKKKTIVVNSTIEAEYVVAASCCEQVLWIQNQMLDYGFNLINTKIYIDNESTICIMKN
nr:retrovirus-related Pol polyprotein from transposon TNT 1-94 [Tanacetum cinerariifolium]